ncbi:MAG: HAD family hydrolase [Thermoanaerobaculia bacterium]
MSAAPAVRAVLLDFGGTLDADGVAWKERFRRLFADEGADAEGFERAFYDADDALVGAIPRDLSLEETVQRLSAGVAQNLGRPEAAERASSRFLADARAHLARNAEVLERLHGRYRVAIVSNFYGNLEAVCRETGLAPHYDAAIDSVVVKAEKPDRRIFEAALAAVGVSPRRAVFVGDSQPRDMAGARAVGMRHVWLRAGDGAPCCPGDPVIACLPQLPGVLP